MNDGNRTHLIEEHMPPEIDSINDFSIPENLQGGFPSKSMEELHSNRHYDFSPFHRNSPLCEDTSHFNFEEH
jgi:hypothetical protein